MFMDSTQTKWTVVATNWGSPGPLAARGYCGVHPRRRVVTRTVMIPLMSSRATVARCPEGEVLLAGGYTTQLALPTPEVRVTKMRRKDARTLEVRGVAGTTDSWLQAIAYCGPGPAPSEHSAQVAIDGNDPVTPVTATCPTGKKLIFGGFAAVPSINRVDTALPGDLHAKDSKQWTVRGLVEAGSSPLSGVLRAFAYCRA
jgi:hypothetical protein